MILVFDTETIGLTDRSVYDLSWLVIDQQRGHIIAEHAYLVEQVFCDRARMNRAFFGDKVFSVYPTMLADGVYRLASWATIRRDFNASIAQHKVSRLWAYNAQFDVDAIKATSKLVELSGRFLASAVSVGCIWANACNSILRSRNFRQWAMLRNMVSASGNLRTDAGTVARYIIGEDHHHSHIGVEDCRTEWAILRAILARKRRILVDHFPLNPWKLAQ